MPAHLVDINRLVELATLDVERAASGSARWPGTPGQRVQQAAAAQPLLREALRLVAHPVIRNRGTVVGSLAHADPAAELPAVCPSRRLGTAARPGVDP